MKTFANLALFFSVLVVADVAYAQTYFATLSGTTSQGSGGAKVVLFGTTLSTDIYFGNLDSSSKAAYILCCDADPTRAKIATLNLIDGEPSGPQGAVRRDLDLTLAKSWDSTFTSGDLVGARSRLTAALAAGQAHFVVLSTAYPDVPGEIGGKFAATTPLVAARGAANPLRLRGGPTLADLNPLTLLRNLPSEPYGFSQLQSDGTFLKFVLAGGNDYLCSGFSERCVFPVYVSSTYDQNGVATVCQARVDYGTIQVPRHKGGKTIRVVWQLVEGDIGDTGDYRFMDTGIAISQNDPTRDFNGKGRESADGKRFKWLRVGTRTGTSFSYAAWVERFDPATGKSLTCGPADPTIANTN